MAYLQVKDDNGGQSERTRGELVSVKRGSFLAEFLGRCDTSLDLAKPEERALLSRCAASGEIDGARATNLVIRVEHFMLRDTERNKADKTGKETCRLLTLISPDGEVWNTTSENCIRSFAMLCLAFGALPWRPARSLIIQRIELAGGHSTYVLQEVKGEK